MASFSTSAATSRTKKPLNAVRASGAMSRRVRTAAAARISSARKWVSPRRACDRNRSTISSAKAAPQTNISGTRVCRSAWVTMAGSIRGSLRQLAGGELGDQLGDGGVHQVGERLRVHAEREHANCEHAQYPGFARVDVRQ